jgi:hypothetical protein
MLLNLPSSESNIYITTSFFKQLASMLPSNVSLNHSDNVAHLREQLVQFLPAQLKEEFQEVPKIKSKYHGLYLALNKSVITIKYLVQRRADVYRSYLYEDPFTIEVVKLGRLNLVKYVIEDFKIDLTKFCSSIKLFSIIASRSGHLKSLVEKSGLTVHNIKILYFIKLL